MRKCECAVYVVVAGFLLLLASCAGTGSAERVADEALIENGDTIVPATFQPEPLKLVSPKYPQAAAAAGIEGRVYVKVYVDKHGDVLQAILLRGSGSDVGFEEAALEAAKKGKWKPAETVSREKVGSWVAYPITFELR